MKRFRKYLIFILIGLVFIGTFAYLFKRSKPKEIRYEELTPAVKDIVKSTVVTGKIQPRDEVNVKAQISGIVAELYKEAGQLVEKNEVIAKLKGIAGPQAGQGGIQCLRGSPGDYPGRRVFVQQVGQLHPRPVLRVRPDPGHSGQGG